MKIMMITFMLWVFIVGSSLAVVINVPGDYVTIQGAIADGGTVNGDEIVVQPGTYVEAINFLGKAITGGATASLRLTTPG